MFQITHIDTHDKTLTLQVDWSGLDERISLDKSTTTTKQQDHIHHRIIFQHRIIYKLQLQIKLGNYVDGWIYEDKCVKLSFVTFDSI